MLFRPITQKIADYLNMDGNLDSRKRIFCILNMGASGGIMGLFLLLVLYLLGMINDYYLLLELVIVSGGSYLESMSAFRTVERREIPGQKPSKTFTRLCMLPMMVYLILTIILMIL